MLLQLYDRHDRHFIGSITTVNHRLHLHVNPTQHGFFTLDSGTSTTSLQWRHTAWYCLLSIYKFFSFMNASINFCISLFGGLIRPCNLTDRKKHPTQFPKTGLHFGFSDPRHFKRLGQLSHSQLIRFTYPHLGQ